MELLPAAVLHGPITVRIRRGAWSIVDALGFQPALDGLPALDVALLSHPQHSVIALDERLYPGSFRLAPDQLDADRDDEPIPASAAAPTVDVVNHVPLERYLPGVLARELFQHWRPATFEAQAIAARAFACAEHLFFRHRRHFDVTDNASSQMYIGLTASEPAVRAVAATAGIVLSYRDHLVPGYYSSCCGGAPARAIDAIGDNPINAMPPLDGAPRDPLCESAPTFHWTHQRRQERASARVRTFARRIKIEPLAGLERLEAIEVAQRNPHGRPISYHLRGVGPAGTIEHELSAARLRLALDFPVVGWKRPRPPMWSGFVDARFADGGLVINGRGHGHGVGLCQYGAQALAERGRDAFSILRTYYPSVGFATIPQP
jgi:stage II sporulation protein D